MAEPDKIKQVILMRNDLNMRKGKMIAQGAHAAISFLTKGMEDWPYEVTEPAALTKLVSLTPAQALWCDDEFTKICLQVNSEAQLLALHAEAIEEGLEAHLILDAGLTEFQGVETYTCAAIGPDLSSRIDPLTGHLKLM